MRMAKYRERQKSIAATETDVTQRYVTRYADVTQRYATEEDIEEDIDKNIKEIDKEKPTRHKYGENQNVLLIDLHNRNLAQKNELCSLSMTCH